MIQFSSSRTNPTLVLLKDCLKDCRKEAKIVIFFNLFPKLITNVVIFSNDEESVEMFPNIGFRISES